jgi:phosphopantothenoylcysteine decarboxylase/phosphopantothenate--cysteine ligase
LEHPTTQASIKKLVEFHLEVLPTGSGDLACGDVGLGRLIEPNLIVERIEQRLQPKKKLKILITAGGTKVPIDSVRSITNTSTGRTGAQLADYFTKKNYEVDLLLSRDGFSPVYCGNITRFTTYDDLARLMEEKIKRNKYDLIVHAAAVSDFKVARPAKGKLASGEKQTLVLEPTEKLLHKIKVWSKKSKVIGFKLTDTADQKARKVAVSKIFAQGAELVVHNDLSEISGSDHVFNLISPRNKNIRSHGTEQLAYSIEKEILL